MHIRMQLNMTEIHVSAKLCPIRFVSIIPWLHWTPFLSLHYGTVVALTLLFAVVFTFHHATLYATRS